MKRMITTLLAATAGIALSVGCTESNASPNVDKASASPADMATPGAARQGKRGRRGKRGDWKKRRAEMVKKYDVNKNGKLEPAERKAMKLDRAKAMIKKLDTNNDGKLSKAELSSSKRRGKRMARHFDKIDTNKDSLISVDELAAARGRHGKRGKRGKRGNWKHKGGSGGAN